tara:strand:- start:9425 stop:10012 length:588 start_codon:yes stop_codon:yes gene_type:complete
MPIRLQLRRPDGKFISGSTKEAEKIFTIFGSNVIKGGRKILNKKKKRATGDLFNDYHYTLKSTKTSLTMAFEFGKASDYWAFVDEGVKGAGGFKGSGRMRGQGSPFKFKTKQPPLSAILPWVKLKGIGGKNQRGIAFAIALNIKRRGLERTQFFSKPLEEQIQKLPTDIVKGFANDVEKLLDKLPDELVVIKDKI